MITACDSLSGSLNEPGILPSTLSVLVHAHVIPGLSLRLRDCSVFCIVSVTRLSACMHGNDRIQQENLSDWQVYGPRVKRT